MAPSKKSNGSASKARSAAAASSSSSQPTLKRVKGENFYRNAKAAARIKMRSGGKPKYDRDGKMVKAAPFQAGEGETKLARVQPDRRWFGNTRVISQTALDHFRTSLSGRANDPYSVLLKRNKLPMTLLDDAVNPAMRKRSHIVETEPFQDTFGPKAQRKRPRLDVGTFEELSKLAESTSSEQQQQQPPSARSTAVAEETTHADHIEPIYSKGTSRRICGELYKVIDSSDVILHVLDARDPLGTMCTSVLEYNKKEKAHKHVVLILNKCDLVPAWGWAVTFVEDQILRRSSLCASFRKRMVVFMDEGSDTSKVPYILPEFDMIWENPFDSTDATFPCSISRIRGTLGPTDHMNLLNHFLDFQLFGSILISDLFHASTTNGIPSILVDANGCAPLNGGRSPNFLLFEWVNIGAMSLALDQLNGLV